MMEHHTGNMTPQVMRLGQLQRLQASIRSSALQQQHLESQ
jgi:hypothetical protein